MRPMRSIPVCLALLGMICVAPLRAQVSEIQIAPVTLTLTVGEERTFLATAYDSRGNPLATANLTWRSMNTGIVEITFDPTTPNVVTVRAVSVGVTQIEAQSGAIRERSVIQVVAAEPVAPVLPDSVLPPEIEAATLPLVGRIEPAIYGTTPTCRVGGFVASDLMVTTYTAIRGADRITVTLPGGRTIDGVLVATHDVNANVAILQVPGAGSGSIGTGSTPTTQTRGWALGQPGCAATIPISLQVSTGGSNIDRPLGNGELGAPIVDRAGNLLAIGTGGTDAIPISSITPLINRARANAAAGTTASPGDVADRENHRFGTLVVQSDATGAQARITPVETWHWSDLAVTASLPQTFNGPVGRYRVELLTGGQIRDTQTAQVAAGTTTQFTINLPVVAPPQPPPGPAGEEQIAAAGGGGGFPIAILLVGLAAAGGGAAFLLGGGGPPPPPPVTCADNPTQPSCPGAITIRIPIPE